MYLTHGHAFQPRLPIIIGDPVVWKCAHNCGLKEQTSLPSFACSNLHATFCQLTAESVDKRCAGSSHCPRLPRTTGPEVTTLPRIQSIHGNQRTKEPCLQFRLGLPASYAMMARLRPGRNSRVANALPKNTKTVQFGSRTPNPVRDAIELSGKFLCLNSQKRQLTRSSVPSQR